MKLLFIFAAWLIVTFAGSRRPGVTVRLGQTIGRVVGEQ